VTVLAFLPPRPATTVPVFPTLNPPYSALKRVCETLHKSQMYESTAADQQQSSTIIIFSFLVFLLHIITLFALAIYVRVNTIKNNILAGLLR
jgi:hypothetical protein